MLGRHFIVLETKPILVFSGGFAKLLEIVLIEDLPDILIFIIADLLFFVSAVKTISDPFKMDFQF